MQLKKWTQNLPIRSRLFLGYMLIVLLVLLFGNITLYFFVSSAIHDTITRELSNSTIAIRTIIETAAERALKNKLQTVAEQNLEIIIGIYKQDLQEQNAKELATNILTSQSIEKNGYVYVVNSFGDIQVHPDNTLLGKKIPSQDFITNRTQRKYGYLELPWKDPQTDRERIKSLYMTYFGPWDWIISATLFKDELPTFINIADMREAVLSRQFGQTGFAYVLDSKGTLLIHPKRQGQNVYNAEDSENRTFIQEMCNTKRGTITYYWQNPGDSDPRKTIAFYDYIPTLDWIVVSAGYLEEYYRPLSTLRRLILTSLVLMTAVALILAWVIGNTITEPIKYLMFGMKAAHRGDFSKRLSPQSTDELGQLESYFNTFISQLEESSTRLFESEQGFRSIFENSVEGIFQFDMSGEILKVNPSFVSMLGYSSSQDLLDNHINFHRHLIVKKEIWNDLLELIISERAVKGFELQVRKKSGAVFWCLLNAKGIHDAGSDEITRVEGFLSDINDSKEARESQEKILEDLESMVGIRTAELSTRISELEHRNSLNRYMGEMADMLQSCRSVEETYPVINQYLKMLFPQDTCMLYLHDSNKQIIDQVVPPPSPSEPFNTMTNDNCWALRRGKSYLFKDMDPELACAHVEEAPQGYLCLPLIAHGVTTGLLHIIFQDTKLSESQDRERLLDQKTRLCSRLAEHLSLALANLSLQEELKKRSIQDSLTGLANRRHMEDMLQRQFHRMLRHNTPCSVIMLDVDHFKKFNDTYGHDLGDAVLKELGKYLQENIRGEDLACRYGGEEFIIILVETDTAQATTKAERIRAEIAETISIPYLAKSLNVTVSLGVATSPEHGKTMTELLKSVDTALYLAKNNGRNRVEVAERGTE